MSDPMMTAHESAIGVPAADPEQILRDEFLGWVTDHFAIIESPGRGIAWCAQWWEHPEAAARIWALWQAYVNAESATGQGDLAAMSSWWINHWDRHASVLFDKTRGPFRYCEAPNGHLQHADGGEDTTLIFETVTPPIDAIVM